MATPKFKEVFQMMLDQNKELFEEFKKIHDSYATDPKAWQSKFNEVGRDVQDIIRRYENRLCSHSEGSGYGKFTNSLSDKFHAEIKNHFPKIDSIGLTK